MSIKVIIITCRASTENMASPLYSINLLISGLNSHTDFHTTLWRGQPVS